MNDDFSARMKAQDERLDALEIITKAECEKARAERDAALETIRELSAKVDSPAFARWLKDHNNQQRAERAEARIAELEAALKEAFDDLSRHDGDPDKGSYAINDCLDTLRAALAKGPTT